MALVASNMGMNKGFTRAFDYASKGSGCISRAGMLTNAVVVRAGRSSRIRTTFQREDGFTEATQQRRSMLLLLAGSVVADALVNDAQAASAIKLEGPPPPSGGLPGTENADQARDVDLPLKERFYIQPLSPADAVVRVKDSATDIINVKSLIDKKAWPYVQNDLRNKVSYLRYDLNTIISSKDKLEKKALKALSNTLFEKIDALDYAARLKSTPKAEKYYEETVKSLKDVLGKIA